MANDLNQCNFIGRLGGEPEIKYMSSGAAVANFSIAIGKQWKDKQTGNKQERTEWVRITAFNRLAEIIGEYCHKGSKVFITGEFRTRKWQAEDGTDRYSTEIVAREIQMLDSRSSGGQQNAPSQQQAGSAQENQQQASQGAAGNFDDFDSEIPF